MMHAVLSNNKSDHQGGTNVGHSHYIIVQEEWHLDELMKWLRMIDLLACGEKWDGRNVARQGNGRRLCYAQVWYVSGLELLLYGLGYDTKWGLPFWDPSDLS